MNDKSILLNNLRTKEWFVFIVTILLLIDIAILLNIPFLRQIFGFLFLTILPGLLILRILKLNKIDFLEKFVLTWGLSISFLMFFGLLLNNLSLSFDYEMPLATIPLLISFNLAFIVLAVTRYKVNKEPIFSLPNLNLSTSEKVFLIVPILFPAVSIFGMHIMSMTDNNIILMFLLFSIPIYVAFVCFFNQKFPEGLYPTVIFSIGISLLLLIPLRSNHIMGMDAHLEYYLFQTTLDNLHWRVLALGKPLDACLSISIFAVIYQSILNIPSEFLFKILYPVIFSISPLVIYIISKKYVEEGYAFLASCFFMFQSIFLITAMNARTSLAILFFALAMMTLFNDKIEPLKKRILFIVFMASCMVSHYSTTYIFFFILLGAFVGMVILSKKYKFKKVISLTIVILFFSLIFFWYSQVTKTSFNEGIYFVERTLSDLNMFFVVESRVGSVEAMLGEGIMEKGIPHKMQFVFTWLTFALIGIGIATLIRRYKEMSFSELGFKKSDFLKCKFEVTYFMIAVACFGLLVVKVVLPHMGYSLDRVYAVAITILSVFFVIGGITLSKHFFFLKKKTCAKRKSINQNGSQVRAYLIILLVLIPYFLCLTSTGVIYYIFGCTKAIILNSEGEQYDLMYVSSQDSYGAKWLGSHRSNNIEIYSDYSGGGILWSQGKIPYRLSRRASIFTLGEIDGYIYLRYYNVVDAKLLGGKQEIHSIAEYQDKFVGKNKIYSNGGSEVWR